MTNLTPSNQVALLPFELLETAPDYWTPVVYIWVVALDGDSEKGCQESAESLAKSAKVDIQSTQDALQWLSDNGWLEVVTHQGTTAYRITAKAAEQAYEPK